MSTVFKSYGPKTQTNSPLYDLKGVQLSDRRFSRAHALVFYFGPAVLANLKLKDGDFVAFKWGFDEVSGGSSYSLQVSRANEGSSAWQLKPHATGGAMAYVTHYPDFYLGRTLRLLRLPHEILQTRDGPVCSLTLPKAFFLEPDED